MSKKNKPKKVFVEGPILPEKIATSIANHQHKTEISEHSIFLAPVQQEQNNGQLIAIDYSVNEDAVEELLLDIRENAFNKFDLSCLHIYHSLGEVNVGEIYFFVFTSSPKKKVAAAACNYLVEEFKEKVAVTENKRYTSTHVV